MDDAIPFRGQPFMFGLRTMFVAVTIVALALSWQLRVVRQREALRESIKASGGQLASDVCPNWMGRITSRPDLFPQWRRHLGDRRVDHITFIGPWTPADPIFSEASRLFPEAGICVAESADGPWARITP